ncbi:response regulator [bacterium]|nr:response regulator [bacterium]
METMGQTIPNSQPPFSEMNHSLEELQQLNDSFWRIQSSTDFWSAVLQTLNTLKTLIDFENALLLIYNSDKHGFNWQGIGSITENDVKKLQAILFESLFYYVISDKRPLILDHTLKEIIEGHNPLESGNGSCLAVPVIQDQKAIGLLVFEHSRKRAFSDQSMHIAMLYANHLGFAYHRFQFPIVEESLAQRYHNLFERINIPLFYCTTDGNIQCANQSFLDLMEFNDVQEAFEINLFECIQFTQHRYASFRELVNRCGYFKNLEAKIFRQDGQSVSVLISILPLRNEARDVTGYEGMLWDITEKRDLEAQLIQAQKLGALGSLTGGIAHDFNNLIGGIMGCASMLLSEIPDSHPFYNDILTIMAASRRAADLTGQLLSFSRKHQYQINNVCTTALIHEVVNLLTRTLPKHIQIKTEIEDNIYQMRVDETQMEQALMNICINARDAMPNGGELFLEVQNIHLDNRAQAITKTLESGPYVLIRIHDTGSGMSKDIQKHIFEPFFTTKSVNQGSGLGLAIVADIIQKHKGCVSVQSNEGKGSVFELLIPACTSEEDQLQMAEEDHSLPRGDETLLLVDDEDVIRRMGKRMLEKYGYHVILAQDGEEAVQIYQDQDVDLVIIDMIMPKLDGVRTLRRLKSIRPDVKAILFTGNVTEKGRQRCLEEGFLDLVTKPFETSNFLNSVRQAIDGQS